MDQRGEKDAISGGPADKLNENGVAIIPINFCDQKGRRGEARQRPEKV